MGTELVIYFISLWKPLRHSSLVCENGGCHSSTPFSRQRPFDLHGRAWQAHTQTSPFSLHHNPHLKRTKHKYQLHCTKLCSQLYHQIHNHRQFHHPIYHLPPPPTSLRSPTQYFFLCRTELLNSTPQQPKSPPNPDRKSTRLNSSHI